MTVQVSGDISGRVNTKVLLREVEHVGKEHVLERRVRYAIPAARRLCNPSSRIRASSGLPWSSQI
jgi:hypothetical protein